MAARPSSRPIRLAHVNLIVWGIVVLLLVTYGRELAWASRALPKYLGGGFPYLRESELLNEAQRVLANEHDLDRGEDLLDRSLAIDPNSVGVFFLGEIHFVRGRLDRAMEQYRRYNRIDPSWLPAYLRMAEVHALEGRSEERRAILQRGIEHYSRVVEDYRPRFDETVLPAYNAKAARVHERYREALETLRRELARAE